MPVADQSLPPLGALNVHHVGMSVESLETALAFWEPFLGVKARWRTLLDGAYLGRHVGYPGVNIEAAFIDLPGGVVLELLNYRVSDKTRNPEATANSGNAHICLGVADCSAAWQRAVLLGARPLVAEGPVDVDKGPNSGARASYLRIHDGFTLELYQSKPPS
jgi:catechol 2,3-dioxygenase-like lactoylglutathione lyase family enzyme